MYKSNRVCLLRRRRQRAPLRGEDLADDRVEAVAVLDAEVDGGETVGPAPRILRASRRITSRSAPTAGARSTLLTTRTSACVMPGPPLRGTLS